MNEQEKYLAAQVAEFKKVAQELLAANLELRAAFAVVSTERDELKAHIEAIPTSRAVDDADTLPA
jgi:hypothetical protein